MEKNPISFLQEQMIKKRIVPTYTLIEQTSGSNLNFFKIRVQCGTDTAEGQGSSKKEAKVNAAMELINQLKIGSHANLSSPQMKMTHNDIIVNNSMDSSSLGINYIGKLQEFAAQKHDKLPEYNSEGMSGMSHLPVFTIVCKYNGFEEKATGNSKKEAKNLAAKMMYEKVSSGTKVYIPEAEVDVYLKTMSDKLSELKLYEDNKIAFEKSAAKAAELFLPLSKTTTMKNPMKDKISYDECHTFLKNSFSVRERELVIDKLQDTMNACKSNSSYSNIISHLMTLLRVALKGLNISIKEIDYGFQHKYAIFNLQLDTDPVISEIGFGKDRDEAQKETIFQMAKTVSVMLY